MHRGFSRMEIYRISIFFILTNLQFVVTISQMQQMTPMKQELDKLNMGQNKLSDLDEWFYPQPIEPNPTQFKQYKQQNNFNVLGIVKSLYLSQNQPVQQTSRQMPMTNEHFLNNLGQGTNTMIQAVHDVQKLPQDFPLMQAIQSTMLPTDMVEIDQAKGKSRGRVYVTPVSVAIAIIQNLLVLDVWEYLKLSRVAIEEAERYISSISANVNLIGTLTDSVLLLRRRLEFHPIHVRNKFAIMAQIKDNISRMTSLKYKTAQAISSIKVDLIGRRKEALAYKPQQLTNGLINLFVFAMNLGQLFPEEESLENGAFLFQSVVAAAFAGLIIANVVIFFHLRGYLFAFNEKLESVAELELKFVSLTSNFHAVVDRLDFAFETSSIGKIGFGSPVSVKKFKVTNSGPLTATFNAGGVKLGFKGGGSSTAMVYKGPGNGPDNSPGNSPGNSPVNGPRNHPGNSPGNSPGYSPGIGTGNGPGNGVGNGPDNGLGNGLNNGPDKGIGNGAGNGPGNGLDNSPGNGPYKGPGNSPVNGSGNGPDNGPGNGSGNNPVAGPDNSLDKGTYKGSGNGPDKGTDKGPDKDKEKPSKDPNGSNYSPQLMYSQPGNIENVKFSNSGTITGTFNVGGFNFGSGRIDSEAADIPVLSHIISPTNIISSETKNNSARIGQSPKTTPGPHLKDYQPTVFTNALVTTASGVKIIRKIHKQNGNFVNDLARLKRTHLIIRNKL